MTSMACWRHLSPLDSREHFLRGSGGGDKELEPLRYREMIGGEGTAQRRGFGEGLY